MMYEGIRRLLFVSYSMGKRNTNDNMTESESELTLLSLYIHTTKLKIKNNTGQCIIEFNDEFNMWPPL